MNLLYYRDSSISPFILMLTTLLVLINTVFSHNPEWIVYHTDNSDLPSNKIRFLTTSTQGEICILTYDDQLANYDGEDWTVYSSDNSEIPDTDINAITFDLKMNLWIGTDSGLIKLSNESWTIYNSDNSVLPNDTITNLVVDNKENLWIMTYGGLVKLGTAGWTVYGELVSHEREIFGPDSHGNIWFITGDRDDLRLYKFDGINLTIDSLQNSHEIHLRYIHGIVIDKQDNIWIATTCSEADGCAVYRISGTEWTRYQDYNWGFSNVHLHPLAIAIDSHENIWVGLGGGWIAKFDRMIWTLHKPDSSVLSDVKTTTTLAIDKYDNKWFGTYGSGLIVYREGGVAVNVKENLREFLPLNFSLSQNYPNPFNPTTVISWQLAVSSDVELSIYNLLGQKIETLVNKPIPAGYHEIEFNGQNLSSGVYLYRIQADEWQDVRKMVLLQ